MRRKCLTYYKIVRDNQVINQKANENFVNWTILLKNKGRTKERGNDII